ncbi:hypothetical protein [Stackebrandtia soli]|uniref:hypothetical protein n=1 Tax=Stackebrandtia soli TaxID=1892856 RepID=UPI0039E88E9E
MPDVKQFRALLQAVVDDDRQTVVRLENEISEEDFLAYDTFVAAVFYGVVDQAFPENDLEQIRDFVDELRSEVPSASGRFKPLIAEGLIRAAIGEEHLLDDIAPSDQIVLMFPIIRKIVVQSAEVRESLDDHFTDAEALAESWSEED